MRGYRFGCIQLLLNNKLPMSSTYTPADMVFQRMLLDTLAWWVPWTVMPTFRGKTKGRNEAIVLQCFPDCDFGRLARLCSESDLGCVKAKTNPLRPGEMTGVSLCVHLSLHLHCYELFLGFLSV